MKKIKMDIKGMHCRSCEMLIKEALEDEEGVKNAELSHTESTAIITFDEGKINEDEMKKIIRKEGYEVK